MKVDKNKKYRTKDDHEVRIYADDGGGEYPIHGAILVNGKWFSSSWHADGRILEDINTQTDLVEVTEHQDLIEEVKRRYKDGQTLISPMSGEKFIFKLEAVTYSGIDLYDSVTGLMISYKGGWAEIVTDKPNTVEERLSAIESKLGL